MNVLILNGNSEKESFSKSICAAYEDGANTAGHIVSVVHIGDLQFDPVLHEGHHIIQPLEKAEARISSRQWMRQRFGTGLPTAQQGTICSNAPFFNFVELIRLKQHLSEM